MAELRRPYTTEDWYPLRPWQELPRGTKLVRSHSQTTGEAVPILLRVRSRPRMSVDELAKAKPFMEQHLAECRRRLQP